MRRQVGLVLFGAGGLVAGAAVGACESSEPWVPTPVCPNELPTLGGDCTAGLVCNYVSTCTDYFVATCDAAGHWQFDASCGQGGSAGSGGQSSGGGGAGGGGCIDDQPGPPALVSATSFSFAPDKTSGSFGLTFSEPVEDVASHLAWAGGGALGTVTGSGTSYTVRFTDLPAGQSATLTLSGVTDLCGTAMADAVVSVEVKAHCHYFEEGFSGTFLDAGFEVVDGATDGNVWKRNDELGLPSGVPNHTAGTGTCATTNGVDSAIGSAWDTDLLSPPIDLTGASHVVLYFESALEDPTAASIEASADGQTFTPLASYTTSHAPERVGVDLSAFAGDLVFLRWRYQNDGGPGAYWDVDDLCVEEFTQPSCSCPPTAYNETKDTAGGPDGNGAFGTAEPTLHTFSASGDELTVCGELEGAAASGADFFAFTVAAPDASTTVQATVKYCFENALQGADATFWLKQVPPVALAGEPNARGEGTFAVALPNYESPYLALTPGPSPYTKTRYAVTVTLDAIPTPLLAEGFEDWPPYFLTPTDDDGCLDWAQSAATVEPYGYLPTEGDYLAYFNSYDCTTGSESLESDALDLSAQTSVMLSFDMFHDTAYPTYLDSIQVEYDDGGGWLPIGTPFVRPGLANGWATESLDLGALAGLSSVRIRLKATTAYGTDVHIDNVRIVGD